MERWVLHRRRALAAIFLVVPVITALAWDIDASFSMTNLQFSDDRVESDTDIPILPFPWPWGVDVAVTHATTPENAFGFGYRHDDILGHQVFGSVDYRSAFLTAEVGLFVGAFNAKNDYFTPGMSTEVGFDVPGLAFASVRTDRGFTSVLVKTGDYLQELSNLQLGFYVPNAIATAEYEVKTFQIKTSTGTTTDRLTSYAFITNIFVKNIPYRIRVRLAYEDLQKIFSDGTSSSIHGWGSLLLGTRVEIDFAKFLTYYADLDSNIYSFGTGEILGANPDASYFYFRASTGFRFDIDPFLPGGSKE